MKLKHSVAKLQKEHVVMGLECIDRMYLNAYVPKLKKSTVADGRCRTRIITDGVIPSLHLYYKDTHSKQYLKAASTGARVRNPKGSVTESCGHYLRGSRLGQPAHYPW
jgi:hypothetical protein